MRKLAAAMAMTALMTVAGATEGVARTATAAATFSTSAAIRTLWRLAGKRVA